MKQASPEVTSYSREDILPKNTNPVESWDDSTGNITTLTTSDVIILGEDAIQEYVPPYYREPGFIGPVDATNESRGLIENQARDLAKIAVINFPLYDTYRAKAIESAKLAIAGGTLRLAGDFDYPTVNEQVEKFISATMLGAYEPVDEVQAELKTEREAQRRASTGTDKLLQTELDNAREIVLKQGKQILAVRAMLVERGASDEFVREFDYTTKLMTKPEQEAFEKEMQLTPEDEVAPLYTLEELKGFQKFLGVLATGVSFGSIRNLRVIAPHSAPIVVITQPNKVA